MHLGDRQEDPFGPSQGSGRGAGQTGPDLASSETCMTLSGGASLLALPPPVAPGVSLPRNDASQDGSDNVTLLRPRLPWLPVLWMESEHHPASRTARSSWPSSQGPRPSPTRWPWTHSPSRSPLFLLGPFQTQLRISSSGASWALPWPAGGPCSSPAPLTRASAADQCLCSPQSQALIHLEEDALMPKVMVLGGEAQGRGAGRRAGSPRWAPSTIQGHRRRKAGPHHRPAP